MRRERHSSRVRRVYDDTAARYEVRWRRYLDESLTRTIHAVHLTSGERMLDLGCGTGLLVRRVLKTGSGVKCWGVDLSPEMLATARSKADGRAVFVVADAAVLPFPDERFDAVISSSSLHHWPEPEAAFEEIRRVLRPDGRLVITDWNRDVSLFKPFAFYLRQFDRSVHHIYSTDEVRRLMAGADFAVTGIEAYRIPPTWGMMTVVGRRRG